MCVLHQEDHRRELLPGLPKTELGGLLDGVGPISAGAGDCNDLRLGGLCRQQVGREFGIVEWMPNRSQYGPSIRLHDGCDIGRELVTEGGISTHDEPALAAILDHCARSPMRETIGAVCPLHAV